MKVREIKTHVVVQHLDKPFGMSQWLWNVRSQCLVEIVTDDGITGWGECFGPAQTNAALINELYAPLIIGQNPLSRAVLWEKMYNRSREFGRKGIAVSALSGIDMALWDIYGKVVGQPICNLLGGPFDTRVESYASGFYYQGDYEDNIEAEAEKLLASGYKAFKMKTGALTLQEEKQRVQRVRRAIGTDSRLAVDANRAYTVQEAIQFGQSIEAENIAWFEEPVLPDELQGYAHIRSVLRMPIAGGESEYTRFGFRQLFEQQCVDIVQPDIAACGGISEAFIISAMSTAYGVVCYPHLWGSAVSLAATLHLIAALPDTVPSLARKRPLLELDQAPNVFRDKLANLKTGPVISVPLQPGLGIELDLELIKHYEV